VDGAPSAGFGTALEIGTYFDALKLEAGGSILIDYPTDIWGYGVAMIAGDRIDLTLANPHVGVFSGPAPSLGSSFGDPVMISQMNALLGTSSTAVPEGIFIAPNEIKFGLLEFWGDYLYLQSNQITFTQDVLTLNPETFLTNENVIVQMLPYSPNQTISIESVMPSSMLAGTTYFTQADHFGRFPGTSLLLGGSSFAGPMLIGQNGTVNIGSKNFLGLTFGQVTGAGNIVSTGLRPQQVV
jgi:hypothetical protein